MNNKNSGYGLITHVTNGFFNHGLWHSDTQNTTPDGSGLSLPGAIFIYFVFAQFFLTLRQAFFKELKVLKEYLQCFIVGK